MQEPPVTPADPAESKGLSLGLESGLQFIGFRLRWERRNDGFRWHMRAFCHKRQRFSDFVLARILRIDGFEASQVDSSQDSHWHTVLTLVLAPHPDLPAAKKRVLGLDYGMEGGQIKLPRRRAFLYCTLRRFGLHTKEAPDPLAQQITSKNRDEIQPYIDALSAQS